METEVEESKENDEKKGQYTKPWNKFGKSIKLGIIEDATNYTLFFSFDKSIFNHDARKNTKKSRYF